MCFRIDCNATDRAKSTCEVGAFGQREFSTGMDRIACSPAAVSTLGAENLFPNNRSMLAYGAFRQETRAKTWPKPDHYVSPESP